MEVNSGQTYQACAVPVIALQNKLKTSHVESSISKATFLNPMLKPFHKLNTRPLVSTLCVKVTISVEEQGTSSLDKTILHLQLISSIVMILNFNNKNNNN